MAYVTLAEYYEPDDGNDDDEPDDDGLGYRKRRKLRRRIHPSPDLMRQAPPMGPPPHRGRRGMAPTTKLLVGGTVLGAAAWLGFRYATRGGLL